MVAGLLFNDWGDVTPGIRVVKILYPKKLVHLTWIHLVATINLDKSEMFVDGKKVASVPRGRYLKFFGRKTLTIGKEQGEQTLGMIDNNSFTGLIGDLAFYRQYKSDPTEL